jgi:lipopolysaccharide biosynthesis glycosyltransferase
MQTIPIIHCFDKNYVLPAAVCFHSLLENAKTPDTHYAIYVLGKGFSPSDISLLKNVVAKFPNASLEIKEPKSTAFDDFKFGNRNHFTSDLFNKLTIPSTFPEFDKVVVADVDVIYEDDIAKVFNSLDTSESYLLAGVWDVCYATWHKKGLFPTGNITIKRYARKFTEEERNLLTIGAGLVVYNNKRLREENIEREWLDFLLKNKKRLTLPEQEAYNFVCHGKIKIMPLGYMSVAAFLPDFERMSDAELDANPAWSEMYSQRIQFHYASALKPWKYPDAPGAKLWFDVCIRAQLFDLWREWYGQFSKTFTDFSTAKKFFDVSLRIGQKVLRLTLLKRKKK